MAAIALLLWIGHGMRARVPQVTTVKLTRQTVEQTVQCTGKVEEADRDIQAVAATGEKVQIRAAIPENSLRQVAVGQRVQISGMAFGQETYAGTVVALGRTAHTSSAGGTVVDAVISLDEADESLRCGLTARVRICVERVADGLLLPYSCLCEDGAERYVYLLQEGRAVRRTVQTGLELADGVLVTAGLPEGACVIATPEQVSGDGARVQEE